MLGLRWVLFKKCFGNMQLFQVIVDAYSYYDSPWHAIGN